jgi:integrase
MQMVKAVFRFGVANDYCTANPLHFIEPRDVLTPHKAQHMKTIKPEELAELLNKIDGYDGDEQTRLGLKLVCHTFVRTNELIGMRWKEINWKLRRWEIPASRMKMRREHFVPLSQQAIEILQELGEINGDHEYVFAGRNPRVPISNNTLLYALYRLGYKGRLTTHGLRSVASTVLNGEYDPVTHERRFHPDWIERQLAHDEVNEVRGAYNAAEYWPQRVNMMQWWSNYLDNLRTKPPALLEGPRPEDKPLAGSAEAVPLTENEKRAFPLKRRSFGASLIAFAGLQSA